MAQWVIERLQRKFRGAVLHSAQMHGNETVLLDPAQLGAVAVFLRDDRDLRFDLPVDCTAVDRQQPADARFEVVWHLYSVPHRHRIRLKVQADGASPQVPSLAAVWPGMRGFECEAWDMYGIQFVGHPDLKRVLLYETFEGHPLRKDYPLEHSQPRLVLRAVQAVPTQRRPPPEMVNRP
jgi:NADH-quinone oxidoreductase subunit C